MIAFKSHLKSLPEEIFLNELKSRLGLMEWVDNKGLVRPNAVSQLFSLVRLPLQLKPLAD